MADYRERSARDLVARFVESLGIRDEKGVVPFVRAWPRIVGPDLAGHSQVLDIRNHAVLVGLDHPGWLQQMHLERRRIIAAVQRDFPSLEVRYLHLTVVDQLETHATLEPSRVETGADTGALGSLRTPKAAQPETPAVEPARAAEDSEFLEHLKRLGEAIERNSSDD